jgi:arylsulfatase A-like enzyme
MIKLIIPVLFLLGCSLSIFGQGEAKKPNFIIVFTDDQTYRAIGYNNSELLTPNLDNLANKGLILNNAFTSTPVCAASRASILTGLYPQTNGTVALDRDSFIQNIVNEKKYQTMAHFLREAGYTTYFSGKSHLGNPKDYGFDFGEETYDFDDKRAFEDVSNFIKGKDFRRQPFFIWMAPRQPHVPLKPAQKWLDLYPKENISIDKNFRISPLKESVFNQGLPGENFYRDSDYTDNYKNLPAGPPRSVEVIKAFTKAYYATITHLDFQIGNLVKQLKESGDMENTVFIFLSDNGYFLGNHGLGNKLTMHEESVRVPMFLYWDKLKLDKHESDALVSSTDILPTILNLAGLPVPDYLHGKSILPILKDQSAQINQFVASESVGVGGEIGTGHRMIRSREWKYILTDINDELLFNLTEDPYEENNLIDNKTYEPILIKLREDYHEWKNLVGDKKQNP